MPIKSVNEATPLPFPRLCMSKHYVLVGLVCVAIASAICCSSVGSSNNIMCLEGERHALLRFKQGLVDDSNALASWKSEKDCCKWRGIECNNQTGELPSLENCTELLMVDLGNNNLSGKIPTWIGQSLPNLLILRLRSNEFNGTIPFSLCSLAAIHVLDLSHNNISGGLPHCFNNITALADDSGVGGFIVELVWKGIEIEFPNITGLRSIDISSNYLIGKIPQSIANMTQLISLNLSRNNLMGKLPENFGNLKMLESLDLSRNQISGKIPASFASLNFLSVLDLSYNNLSGRIPTSTQLQSFDASKYMGNHGLCGPPLTPNCSRDGATQADDNKEHDKDGLISLGFFISVVLGFITGFWMVCGSLLLKTSYRYAYFRFLDNAKDWIFVKTSVYKAEVRRTLQR